MKILVGLSNNLFENNSLHKMHIIDSDMISEPHFLSDDWKELDLNELSQCVNIQVDKTKFQSTIQNPLEYISSNFDLEKIVDYEKNETNFQITNVYYDEIGQPQLYKAVYSDGRIIIHDISELFYRKESSLLGKTVEELPSFVKKEPLSAAYEWWKAKDENAKNINSRYFSGQFEVYENMPVKLLYHYLTGVKGFKVGYHTQTEVNENNSSAVQHEYLLYKDTANIKLKESVLSKEEKNLLFANDYNDYGIHGDSDPYPNKRKLSYYGATMSIICSKENYPSFDIYSAPSSQSTYNKDEIAIEIDYRKRLMYIYNKLEENGCISKDWKLSEHNIFFGMTKYALIPDELSLLSAKLQSEKENKLYGHVMSATNGHWSTFNTDDWIKSSVLLLSTQFYSTEFKEKLNSIFQKYKSLYINGLKELIEKMGAKDALETMKWTKEASREVLKNISIVKNDYTLKKANSDIVDQMSNLYTYKRNNYPLPEWLQIYSLETIKMLGGIDSLQELIDKRGEQYAKEFVIILAEEIEQEIKNKLHSQNKYFISTEEIITEYDSINALESIPKDTLGKSRK